MDSSLSDTHRSHAGGVQAGSCTTHATTVIARRFYHIESREHVDIMRAKTLVAVLYISEFVLAYAVLAWILYHSEIEYRLTCLRATARFCQGTAARFGDLGLRAEVEYHRILDTDRMI